MGKCHRCGKDLEGVIPLGKPGRNDACPFCGSDLRCCLNCGFYTPEAYNGCREPQAERVVEKQRSNFCDYFVFRDIASCHPEKDVDSAKTKLASLFK